MLPHHISYSWLLAGKVNARRLFHAQLLASGVNPHLAERLFGQGSELKPAMQMLVDAGVGLGARSTIRRDLEEVEPMVQAAIK